MAKLSSINKNERRKKLVKQYAEKFAKLKAIADDESLDETERLMARLKMAEAAPTSSFPLGMKSDVPLLGTNGKAMYTKRHATSQKFTRSFPADSFM